MRVYRIEDSEGRGAYRMDVNWYAYDSAEVPEDRIRHPSPYDDSQLRNQWIHIPDDVREEYYFGFYDEAQYRAWFYRDEWLRAIKDAGGKLCIYSIQDSCVLLGHTQLVFQKKFATLVCRREVI